MQPSLIALFKQFPGPRLWPVWIVLGFWRLLSWLPLPVMYWLGVVGGEIVYHMHGSRRSATLRNLAACFPERKKAEIRALAKEHFRILMFAVLILGVGWWSSKSRLNRLTRFRNREVFERARSRGENIILLAPHFVGLEYGGIYLSTVAPSVSMYKRNKHPLVDALIKRYRSRFGLIQYTHKEPLKPMITALRRGCQFYYLPDQDPGRNRSVFAPFYSIQAATFATLGRIARLGNATVIPCATRLLPGGRGFEIIFGQPLENYPCGDQVVDATTMNRAIEALIEYAPEQYFWSHKRFKTRPEGEPKFYQ